MGAITRLRAVRSNPSAGFSLLEMIIVLIILAILSSAAYPLLRNSVKRQREMDLRDALREIRQAIDAYKRFNDLSGGQAIPIQMRTESGYPKTLEVLVEGFTPANVVAAEGTKVRFLRRLPIDPMTDSNEWGKRGYGDDPNSTSWSGVDVWDVYTKSDGVALNGTKYKDW
jgi:general secretion pathway protein G